MGNSKASRIAWNEKRRALRAASKAKQEELHPETRRDMKQLLKKLGDAEAISAIALKATHTKPAIPEWLQLMDHAPSITGVPTLFLSDWHWGEVVDKSCMSGVNEYNLSIARARAFRTMDTTVELLKHHVVSPIYPGLVMCLAGDFFSGTIHEELTATNELPTIPTLLDLYGVMIACVSRMADEFGKVFLPCVTGNHSRTTPKVQSKQRAFTNFDWMFYKLLDKHFENDPRVTFFIPDGPDAYYRIYNTRYLLKHGDSYRGGDGIIGCLGPITRGDMKGRSRNAAIGQNYDVALVGHFHQLIQTERIIVNGSLVGYNEYAYAGGFGFEKPRQALWVTHKTKGITLRMPVNADPDDVQDPTPWVSWKETP